MISADILGEINKQYSSKLESSIGIKYISQGKFSPRTPRDDQVITTKQSAKRKKIGPHSQIDGQGINNK